LALTSVLAQVRARFHVTVSPESFLLSPSVRGLTQLISDETRAAVASRSADPILVPLQVTDSTESVFIIAGAGAPAISLMALCRHLHTDRSVYGLQAKGLESRARPDSSVSAAASMFISRMRGVAPHGPYTLVGHSMGGVVAQEIAVQLDAAGERVDHIIAIDSRLTEAMLRDLPGEPISDPGPPRPAATSGSPAASQITPRALLTMWLQIRLAGVWQFDPVTQWMIFYNTGLRALRRHRMNRCDAPLTVLRTTHNPQTGAMWARATSGPVDVIDVAGEHATLLREPWVREIAQRCQGVLDRLVTTTR
jgi:thioesterase domain-containing protein